MRSQSQQGSVATYAQRFQQLGTQVNQTETRLMFQFHQGLKSNIKAEIILDKYSSLKKLIGLAIAIDNCLHEQQLAFLGHSRPKKNVNHSFNIWQDLED
jgi:hypothetical protein